MTEQPDTTAVRGAFQGADNTACWTVLDLCDALDAARAERGEWNAMLNEANERYESAEARISQALVHCAPTSMVYRALTGEE